MTTDTRFNEPGRTGTPAGEIRFLFLPGRDLFERRAGRLRDLAKGHALEGYLAFLALLTDAQQNALNLFQAVPLPDPGEQERCREHGMPLLDVRTLPRDAAWRSALALILRQINESPLPAAARETVAGLLHAAEADLEQMADQLLRGKPDDIPPRELPFVAAALQVYWVHMASSMGEQAFGRLQEAGVCPVCGSLPVAGVVRTGGAEQGLRYLCCSLCAAQWHMVRIKCSNCESTQGIDYFKPEGSNGAVKAESCDNCGAYLKLLYLEKETRMEAMADDLATIAVDMMMEKEGKARVGLNLFFHPGGKPKVEAQHPH